LPNFVYVDLVLFTWNTEYGIWHIIKLKYSLIKIQIECVCDAAVYGLNCLCFIIIHSQNNNNNNNQEAYYEFSIKFHENTNNNTNNNLIYVMPEIVA